MFFFKERDRDRRYKLYKNMSNRDIKEVKTLEKFRNDFNFLAGYDNIFDFYNRRNKIKYGIKSKLVNIQPKTGNSLKRRFFYLKIRDKKMLNRYWKGSYDIVDNREFFHGTPSLNSYRSYNSFLYYYDLIFNIRTYTDAILLKKTYKSRNIYGHFYESRIKVLTRKLFRLFTMADIKDSIRYTLRHGHINPREIWEEMQSFKRRDLPFPYFYRESLMKITKIFHFFSVSYYRPLKRGMFFFLGMI